MIRSSKRTQFAAIQKAQADKNKNKKPHKWPAKATEYASILNSMIKELMENSVCRNLNTHGQTKSKSRPNGRLRQSEYASILNSTKRSF